MPRISLRLAIIILLLASWLTVPRVKHAQTQAQSPLPVYLIVAPESFADELAGFMVSQQTRGFDVQAVWLVQPYPDSDMIKAAIQSQIPLPKYVLLVGDSDLIPTWTVELASHQVAQTDLFYTTFDGPEDFVPDTILGRLPVHTESELTAYLAKLAAFYTIEWYPPWMKKISFVATNDLAFGDDVEAGFERVIKTYTQPNAYNGSFTGQDGTVSTDGGDRLFPESYQADTEDVLTALDDGRVAMFFNGRAKATSFEWRSGPWLSTSQVNNLASPPVPLVAAFAPNTADFSVGASMADAWILNPESGALTYIGATAETGVIRDSLLMEEVIGGLFSNYAVPLSIGEAFQVGLYSVYDADKVQEYFITYQLFGDPSLTIRFPEGALLTAPFSHFIAPWGGTITLPVTIKNVGPTEATFSIKIDAGYPYPTLPVPNPFNITLPPCGEAKLLIVIDVLGLPVMTSDTINITASYTKTLDEIITTKLAVTFQVFKPSLFLPIINR